MELKIEHAQEAADGAPGANASIIVQKAILRNSSATATGNSRNTDMKTAQQNGEMHCTATMAAQTDSATHVCLT